MPDEVLRRLSATIQARRAATAEASYTRKLLDGGPRIAGKKLAEEAAECVIAALVEDDAALTGEAADVIYHLMVLLAVRDISIDQVLETLEIRMGQSGHAEKAARGKT